MKKESTVRILKLTGTILLVVLFAGISLLLFPVFGSVSSSVEPRLTPAGIMAMRDVTYAEVDGMELALDIYAPQPGAEPVRPVAVYIHGGAWRGGDKRGGAQFLRRLAGAGYLGFSVNYRLSGEAHYPAQIHDCKAAIRWVRAHCAEYGGDPERIAVCGASAGGHLAALLAMSNGEAALEGEVGDCLEVGSEVQVVADWFGPSDLAVMERDNAQEWHRHVLEELFGRPLDELGDALRDASPASYVDSGDVPVLIIHGTADETVPVGQSQYFERVLEKAGVPVEYIEVPGGGHGDFRGCDPSREELIEAMVAFFNEHLNHVGDSAGE